MHQQENEIAMALKFVLYNTDKPVGPKCANAPEDVLLVRFFLKRYGQVPGIGDPITAALPIVPGYDDALGIAIKKFQEHVRSLGKKVTVDGVVSPADLDDGFYTIKYLNATYFKRYPQFNHDLRTDPQCPSPLKEKFSHVVFFV